MTTARDIPTIRLYYDGDCPFCSRFALYAALKRSVDLELIDARQAPVMMEQFRKDGYDINAGLLLTVGDRVLQGAEALLWLDGKLTVATVPDKLRRLLVKHPGWLKRLYPVLNVMRKFVLFLLGRKTVIE